MVKVKINGVYKTGRGFIEYNHMVTQIEGDYNSNRLITGYMFDNSGQMQSMFTMKEDAFTECLGDTYLENTFDLKLIKKKEG